MSATSARILSLDVFRGLTILLMMLVNVQSDDAYFLLGHAKWHGGTLADLVFPFFLFIVGMTAAVVLNKQKKHVPQSAIFLGILKRSLILFVLGLMLNALPNHWQWETFRYYGILQRIAVCYFLASIIYLHASIKNQILIALAILWTYWFLMTQVPVPGFGVNQLTEQGNWVAYVDQGLFSSKHLLEKVYDPEGFLSTLPSIATTLLGFLTGSLLISSLDNKKKLYIMLGFGLVFIALAELWNLSFPINKKLWTSSYVVWSGGYALITFGLSFFLIDVVDYKKWALPFKILGMNALFIFIFHVLIIKFMTWIHVSVSKGRADTLQSAIRDYFFGSFTTQNADLLYAICFVFLNYLVALFLYRRNIFIRI